jgi:hypothetical protein
MFWRRALPVLLITLGICLLTGCFYLPLPEHPTADPSERGQKKSLLADFRHILGDYRSKRPIRPGTSRAQVLALLGKPDANSTQDQLFYTLLAQRAVWVAPLCFSAVDAQLRGYALRLTFDGDTLVRWDLSHVDENRDFIWSGYNSTATAKAVDLLKKNSPSSSASLPTTQP